MVYLVSVVVGDEHEGSDNDKKAARAAEHHVHALRLFEKPDGFLDARMRVVAYQADQDHFGFASLHRVDGSNDVPLHLPNVAFERPVRNVYGVRTDDPWRDRSRREDRSLPAGDRPGDRGERDPLGWRVAAVEGPSRDEEGSGEVTDVVGVHGSPPRRHAVSRRGGGLGGYAEPGTTLPKVRMTAPGRRQSGGIVLVVPGSR